MVHVKMERRKEHHHAGALAKLKCQFIVELVANLESVLIEKDWNTWK